MIIQIPGLLGTKRTFFLTTLGFELKAYHFLGRHSLLEPQPKRTFLRGNFIVFISYIKKSERFQRYDLLMHFGVIEKLE
jgi:hypothetical protein